MRDTDKKIQEIIRVNHAGEFGAQKIYNSQIRNAKNTLNMQWTCGKSFRNPLQLQ